MSGIAEGGSGLQKVLAELYEKLTGKSIKLVSKDAPPTVEGIVRLLRGHLKDAPTGPRGEMFTTNPESAVKWMASQGDNGRVSYVDVPEDIAARGKMKQKVVDSPTPAKTFDRLKESGVTHDATVGNDHFLVNKYAGLKKQILPVALGGAAIEALSDTAEAQDKFNPLDLNTWSDEELADPELVSAYQQRRAEQRAETQMTRGRGPSQLPAELQGPTSGVDSPAARKMPLTRLDVAAGKDASDFSSRAEDALLDVLGGVSWRDVGSSPEGQNLHTAAAIAPLVANPEAGIGKIAAGDALIGIEQMLGKDFGEGHGPTMGDVAGVAGNAALGAGLNVVGSAGFKALQKALSVTKDPEVRAAIIKRLETFAADMQKENRRPINQVGNARTTTAMPLKAGLKAGRWAGGHAAQAIADRLEQVGRPKAGPFYKDPAGAINAPDVPKRRTTGPMNEELPEQEFFTRDDKPQVQEEPFVDPAGQINPPNNRRTRRPAAGEPLPEKEFFTKDDMVDATTHTETPLDPSATAGSNANWTGRRQATKLNPRDVQEIADALRADMRVTAKGQSEQEVKDTIANLMKQIEARQKLPKSGKK